MKCPECVAEGERSRVGMEGTTRTLMPTQTFWDEDGVLHMHDPNVATTTYSCSRGHRWREARKPPCPEETCDFNAEET